MCRMFCFKPLMSNSPAAVQIILNMNKVSKVTPTGKEILKNISLGMYLGAKIGFLGANGAPLKPIHKALQAWTHVQCCLKSNGSLRTWVAARVSAKRFCQSVFVPTVLEMPPLQHQAPRARRQGFLFILFLRFPV